MKKLILTAQNIQQLNRPLPFSICSSFKEQLICNVPVMKPSIIFVLDGTKEFGTKNTITCPAGNFLFLSKNTDVHIRNLPDRTGHFALILEFDSEDFNCFTTNKTSNEVYFQGQIGPSLEQTLQQFIEWSATTPSELWPLRRQEILQHIYHQGYHQIATVAKSLSLRQQIHNMITTDITSDWTAKNTTSQLSMSVSSLQRKLKTEATTLLDVKNKARLRHGLYLVQK
jgi:hypothetical protein